MKFFLKPTKITWIVFGILVVLMYAPIFLINYGSTISIPNYLVAPFLFLYILFFAVFESIGLNVGYYGEGLISFPLPNIFGWILIIIVQILVLYLLSILIPLFLKKLRSDKLEKIRKDFFKQIFSNRWFVWAIAIIVIVGFGVWGFMQYSIIEMDDENITDKSIDTPPASKVELSYVNDEISKANYCEVTTDCVRLKEFGCPFGCSGPLVNKVESNQIRGLIKDYFNGDSTLCFYECSEYFGFSCVENKCRYK